MKTLKISLQFDLWDTYISFILLIKITKNYVKTTVWNDFTGSVLFPGSHVIYGLSPIFTRSHFPLSKSWRARCKFTCSPPLNWYDEGKTSGEYTAFLNDLSWKCINWLIYAGNNTMQEISGFLCHSDFTWNQSWWI